MLVRDYMTQSVTTVADDGSLLDAALVIRRTGKRHVPIISAQTGQVVGIVSDRDVLRLAPSVLSPVTEDEYNDMFQKTPIKKAMTPNPIIVRSDAPLSEAVQTLYSKRVSGLLVVDDGELKGVITTTDMLNVLNEMLTGADKSKSAAEM